MKGKHEKQASRHFTLIRMDTIKQTENNKGLWLRNWNPCALLVGMLNRTTNVENSTEVPQEN